MLHKTDVAALAGRTLSRRQLLTLWDVRFRSYDAVSRVALDLANAGLTTVPDFADGGIDGEVRVVWLSEDDAVLSAGEAEAPREHVPGDRTRAVPRAGSVDGKPDTAADADTGGRGEDPVGLLPQTAMRVGVLPSAGGGVTSITPGGSLPWATGIMMERGYSQLPVLDDLGKLRGVINWASIAHMHATGREPTVSNALTSEFHVVEATAHLLLVLPFIQAHGFVLVRDDAGELTGIVTTADLADEFVAVAGPFFTLGEIERRLRRALGRAYGEDDVRKVHKDPRRHTVDQLMFGEYIRLLDDEQRWKKLNWPGVDRAHFVGLLRHVKDVRNTVMHFNSASLSAEQLGLLDRFVGILRSYEPDLRHGIV
ncbi:CBS domain-containing protein [Streptomyces scopuliridis]|uniref:CBS domain-containing protein n=1 Tax=Streptomyces scopuliridis TaxID=452529 RepID=UPI00368E6621